MFHHVVDMDRDQGFKMNTIPNSVQCKKCKESNNSTGIYYSLSDLHDFKTAFKDFKYGWKKQHQRERLKGYL